MQIINDAGNLFSRMMSRFMPGSPRAPYPATPYYRARYIRNRSKYMPHQGKRECARRVMGGFHGVANTAKITGMTREQVIARCTS